jgi:hypothetical protein
MAATADLSRKMRHACKARRSSARRWTNERAYLRPVGIECADYEPQLEGGGVFVCRD